jgi:hypothetical protein
MLRWISNQVNLAVILVGILVAAGMIAVFVLLILVMPVPASQSAEPPAALTMIVAPTPTPIPTQLLETPTPTALPSVGGISIGSFVQITGTEGQGLRLRSGAGTNNPLLFLGMDAEVFRVKEGPKMADNYTWWFLEAPYDPSRSGWAASNYLKVIEPSPTATP